MKYEFCFGSDAAVLPGAPLRDKLSSATETELKLLCGMACDEALRTDYESAADAFAASIGRTRAELDGALAFWRGAGALRRAGEPEAKKPRPKRPSTPHYTGEELAQIIDGNGLSSLIDECSSILGITMNPTDINTLIAMYHHLGVDEAYIMLVCQYCARMEKRSLAYIQKTAYNLYDEGIDTSARLEEYMHVREELAGFRSKLSTLLGIGGRALTAKETKCFETWNSWGYGEDIVRHAYDITVEKTGKYTISYLDRVLSNWNAAGYRTLAEIEAAQSSYENSKKQESGGSFDTDEFFELALKRSRENAIRLSEDKKK